MNSSHRNILIFLLVSQTLSSCVWIWDKATIYKPPSYSPNYDSRLLINGYYYKFDTTYWDNKSYIESVFFFKDGTVCFPSRYSSKEDLERDVSKPKSQVYFIWGNYLIKNDTVIIEYFDRFNRELYVERNISKYLLKNKQIEFLEWIDRKWKSHKTEKNIIYYFSESLTKPDSTKNQARTRRIR